MHGGMYNGHFPEDMVLRLQLRMSTSQAIIWELEWAFWMGRGKITPHAPWNVFFQYNTEEWNYNMVSLHPVHSSYLL